MSGMSNPDTSRDARDPPTAAGRSRVRFELCANPQDADYLHRRADSECGGDRAVAFGRVVAEARMLRHDLRGKLGALDLIEMCLTSDAMTRHEAAELIANLREEIRAMLRRAGDV